MGHQRLQWHGLAGGHDLAAGGLQARQQGLQERFSFETFVPGPANEFAFAVARRVAAWSDGHFNPVIFHGPYGFGKTHLLNAMAWEAMRAAPDKKVVYLTAGLPMDTQLWVEQWPILMRNTIAACAAHGATALLVERRDFSSFDNAHVVQPRDRKYVLRKDGSVRQLHAVAVDAGKARLIAQRTEDPQKMRAGHGKGAIYRTSLLGKIINLLAVKASLLDPAAIDDVLDALPDSGAASHFHACTHTTFSPNLISRATRSSALAASNSGTAPSSASAMLPTMRAPSSTSCAPLAKATEEFLTMFIDSLVSGGITMRRAIGSST